MIKKILVVIFILSTIIMVLCVYSWFIIDTWDYSTFSCVCLASHKLQEFIHIMCLSISLLVGVLLGIVIGITISKKLRLL